MPHIEWPLACGVPPGPPRQIWALKACPCKLGLTGGAGETPRARESARRRALEPWPPRMEVVQQLRIGKAASCMMTAWQGRGGRESAGRRSRCPTAVACAFASPSCSPVSRCGLYYGSYASNRGLPPSLSASVPPLPPHRRRLPPPALQSCMRSFKACPRRSAASSRTFVSTSCILRCGAQQAPAPGSRTSALGGQWAGLRESGFGASAPSMRLPASWARPVADHLPRAITARFAAVVMPTPS